MKKFWPTKSKKQNGLLVTSTSIVIISFFVLASCTKQENDYFSMHDGARWEYSIEMLIRGRGIQKAKSVDRVDGIENINGKEYYKVVSVTSGIPGAEPETNYYRRTKDGIYKISGKHKDYPEYMITPFPISVGNKWAVQEPEGLFHYTIESIETAELFDRKYENCLKISFEGNYQSQSAKGYSYEAKNIGTVKSVFETDLVTIEYTLEKYEK